MMHPLEKRMLILLKNLFDEGFSETDAKRKLGLYYHVRKKDLSEECEHEIEELCEKARIEQHLLPANRPAKPSKRLGH
jgi:hypothetical protein